MLSTFERKTGPSRTSGAGRSGGRRQESGHGRVQKRTRTASPVLDRPAPRGVSPEESHDASRRAALGALVLVVEDFEDAREILASMLQFYGFRVVEAVKGN